MTRSVELFLTALRRLRRAPGMTVLAALTLALGIGLSTAVFTVAKAVLIRELPITDQDRVVLGWGATRDGRFGNVPFSIEDIRTIQRNSTFVAKAGFFAFRGATSVALRLEDRVFAVQMALVSGNYFEVLGSQAFLGRPLRHDDDVPGAPPVAVLSHRAWLQRFGGDSTVLGRAVITVQSGRAQTIVGVMPPGLEYPKGTEVWVPLVAYSTSAGFHQIVTKELDMVARLEMGVSYGQAREELTRFFGRPGAPVLHRNAVGVIRPFSLEVLGETRPALIVISLAAALLLLIACVNVANMLLMRALDRTREVGVRAALGAGRARIAGESLIETALLSSIGGVLGIALSVAAVRGVVLAAPAILPPTAPIAVTAEMILLGILATIVAALFTSIAPAVFAARIDVGPLLQSGARTTRSPRLRRILEGLVVGQLALAVISLTAAGLVTHSFIRLMRADLSFRADGLLVAPLAVTTAELPDAERTRAAVFQVIERLRALPGVRSAAVSFATPFVGNGGGIDGRLAVSGQTAEEQGRNPFLNLEVAGPDYFATLGIPVTQGRPFTNADREGTLRVVIISASVARHFWPGQSPLGKRLWGMGNEVTVVGVVPDARFRDLHADRPSVYFPILQSPFGSFVPTTLLIRADFTAAALLPHLRRTLAEVTPGLSVVSLAPVESLLDGPRASARLNAVVLAFFAGSALFLASMGVFAIMATMVRRRTHEFGIRMALGASAADVRRLVLEKSVALASLGAAFGTATAVTMNRSLESLLFQVSVTDGATLAAVTSLTILVAIFASFIPARASSRVDPVIALRSDV